MKNNITSVFAIIWMLLAVYNFINEGQLIVYVCLIMSNIWAATDLIYSKLKQK